MENLVKNINEYNDLVEEWNDKYGHLTKGMPVEMDDFCFGYVNRIKSIPSEEMSGRKKVSITITTVGDFDNIGGDVGKNSISRGELANLVVRAGKAVLDSL